MINSTTMQAALMAVEAITGDKIILSHFLQSTPPPFNPHSDSAAWLVYRYPQHYRFIKGATSKDDLYVELKDKHNWVLASEVKKVRDYYNRVGGYDI